MYFFADGHCLLAFLALQRISRLHGYDQGLGRVTQYLSMQFADGFSACSVALAVLGLAACVAGVSDTLECCKHRQVSRHACVPVCGCLCVCNCAGFQVAVWYAVRVLREC